MKILITGAFGNIGNYCLDNLLSQGHQLTCLVRDSKDNRKKAKKYRGKCRIIFGDVLHKKAVNAAVRNQEAVIHLAFILPPMSERQPKLAELVNCQGTVNVLSAMKAQKVKPKLIFASTVVVFGHTQDKKPPRKCSEKVCPTNLYSRHKILCESLIKKSKLNYAILRIGAAMPVALDQMDPIMFEVPLNTRMEFVHPKDAALALANAALNPKVNKKTFLIGGGKKCQLYYKEVVGKAMDVMGIGRLPAKAFGKDPFPTDWMDTKDSQKMLKFQHHTYEDYLKEMTALVGWRKFFIKLLRPFIRYWLLGKSKHWKM